MAKRKKNVHAVALGRKGGKVLSAAKTLASRANGKKGGRPRLAPVLILAALLLTGCTTVLLPSARTDGPEVGRCYEVTHAYIIGWGYWLADGIDGWRCKGMQAGDFALVGDRPGTRPTTDPATGANEKK